MYVYYTQLPLSVCTLLLILMLFSFYYVLLLSPFLARIAKGFFQASVE